MAEKVEMSCNLCNNLPLCAAYKAATRLSRELSSIPIWRGHCFPAVTDANFKVVFLNILAENCERYDTKDHI